MTVLPGKSRPSAQLPLVGIIFLCFCRYSGAQDPASPVLRTVREVISLTPSQLAQPHPVEVYGIITLHNPNRNLVFLQDETAGVFVSPAQNETHIAEGDFVRVKGFSNSGQFLPTIDRAHLKTLYSTNFPNPVVVDPGKWNSGIYDSQWVEANGVIRTATPIGDSTWLQLADGSLRYRACVLGAGGASELRPDRVAKLRGVAVASFDERKRPREFILYVPDQKHVALGPESPEPFSAPVIKIATLGGLLRPQFVDRRVRIHGVVTLQRPRRFLVVEDDSGGAMVESPVTNLVALGQYIEVSGYPSLSRRFTLEDALVRTAGVGRLPATVHARAEAVLGGEWNNRLITVTGKPLVIERGPEGLQKLWLKTGSTLLPVLITGTEMNVNAESAEQLRVTGVFAEAPLASAGQFAKGLWPRFARDIEIVDATSVLERNWKTLVWSAASIGLVALVAAAITRKRKVHAVTEVRTFQDLFDNGNYIVFTANPDGTITDINPAAERILGFSRAEFIGHKIDNFVSSDSHSAWRQLLQGTLAGEPTRIVEIEASTRDQRSIWLDLNVRTDRRAGEVVSIHGIARDVTKRKFAQTAFFRSEHRLRQSFEERERISRDLHDNVIQSIYAVGLGMEDCRQLIPSAPAEAQTRLTHLSSSLNGVIRTVRNFIEGIEAKVLQGKEFKTALKSLALTMGESFANRFVIDIDPGAAGLLTPEETLHLLNISKEAISNSVRYSEPQLITVSLQRLPRFVQLTVEDDGSGFDRTAIKPGFGLRNMEKRAEEMHAILNINSIPGMGTRIVVNLPKDYERKD